MNMSMSSVLLQGEEVPEGAVARAQLQSRFWEIRHCPDDPNCPRKYVDGPVVAGQYPAIVPGMSHKYVSLCPQTQPGGRMRGYFTFVEQTAEGYDMSTFDVACPEMVFEDHGYIY
jgi:ApaG protein